MKKSRISLKNFFHKLKFQYRVSVLNENTLEESWHVRLSRLSVLIYASTLVIFTFTLLTILIFSTPVRYYLPGYGIDGNRNTIITESMVADSLLNESKLQNGYMLLIKSIIAGTIKPDSIQELDSVKIQDLALKFDKKSKAEEAFVKEFEAKEKFNLGTIEPNYNEAIFVFFRPTKGVLSTPFNLKEKQYGISIITTPNETVQSVLDGTIIYTAFTFEWGYVIQIQHQNNYISIYKNNTRLLKRVGDLVKAGEGIALTGEEASTKTGNQFYFELWQNGNPINPEDVIIF